MAGFVVVLDRNRASSRCSLDDLLKLGDHLNPDNIRPNPSETLSEDGLTRIVINPVPGVRVDRRGVCLGALFEDADWTTLGASSPDGTYAILRHDARHLELLTDLHASRTIWYVHTEDAFYASTSQRALVALLGGFEPRREAVTWMLASGHIGPGIGWDARLLQVPSATCLRLDRETWRLTSTTQTLEHDPRPRSADEHLARLRNAIFAACQSLDVTDSPTALTLSGGHDSRSLIVGLARANKPVTCVTWGLAKSLNDPLNDASIAGQLATRFGMAHEYLLLDSADDAPRAVFTRFLRAGEGRIEDFSGYTDGFKAWAHLFDSGIATVLRGDSPGWGFPFQPFNDFVARSIVHEMTLVDDYPPGELIHRLELEPQEPPARLFNDDAEDLDRYRDRIYNEFELPTCMSAFNQVKAAYAEVVNPLLARGVVTAAAELPDELRHLRCGFERIVDGLVPDIPFATDGADEPLDSYLGRPHVRQELVDELSSPAARQVLSGPALEALLSDLLGPASRARSRLRAQVRSVVPRRLVRAVRPTPRPHVTTTALAYRAYIASRSAAILREDAQLLAKDPRPATD